jgi:transcription elongation factor Elf1
MKQNKSKQPKLKKEIFELHAGAGTAKKTKVSKVQKQGDLVCKICEERYDTICDWSVHFSDLVLYFMYTTSKQDL